MTGAWVISPELERRFRRLLLAYPGSYRRRHEAEILTTLMDAAGPGRTRPTAGEIRDLIAGGLRQRFRLPVGRLAAVAALLSALTLGGAGLASGSAAGWATATALPGDTALREMTTPAHGSRPGDIIVHGDDSYSAGPYLMVSPIDPIPGWTLDATKTRLAASGWRIDHVETRPDGNTFTMRPDGSFRPVEAVNAFLVAERHGLLLRLYAKTIQSSPPGTSAYTMVEAAEPPSVLPLAAAGGILGLIAGWLLAARVAYRLRALPLRKRLPIAALATLSAAILAPLTAETGRLAYAVIQASADPGPADYGRFDTAPAYHAYAISFTDGWAAVAGLTGALLVIVLARLLKPTGRPDPEPAT